MLKEQFIVLVDKYLAGTATDNERQLVEEYLARLEAHDRTTHHNEQDLKESMWQQIELNTTGHAAPIIQMPWYRRNWARAIVAASIILMVGYGIFFLTKDTPGEPSIAVGNDKPKDSSSRSTLYREINTTGKEKRIELADGSSIVLANNSEITYQKPFTNSRDITLIGRAYFEVSKDQTKPFTVTSGEISTTALGTGFTVNAYRKNSWIVVRLYEGKVVVKAIDQSNRKMKTDVYLSPGQELVYGDKVFVRAFKVKSTVEAQNRNDEPELDNLAIPESSVPYFMFNNQPLGEVLNDLAGLYNVKIIYDKKSVQNIYWTGKYFKSESLETILNRISVLNNLTITRKDSAFVISR